MIESCYVAKMMHDKSGREFDPGYIEEAIFVETLDFDGPKFMLKMTDEYMYLKDILKVKELDTVTCAFSDAFGKDGMNAGVNFSIITQHTKNHFIRYNMMETPVFSTKEPSKGGSKAFVQKKLEDIIGFYVKGLKLDIGKFPIVENYHCLAGERPSLLMRQIAIEKGALIWADRDTCYFKTFDALWKQPPAHIYHHAKTDEQNTIVEYRVPSQRKQLVDSIQRGYAGWSFDKGKIGGGGAPAFTASQKTITLSNKSKTIIEVIDFICYGNGGIRPGQVIKILWHLPDPARPINEDLPCKIVVGTVSHYYSEQKYYCRVKGVMNLAS